MIYVCLLGFGFLGGWISRMCGGGKPKLKYGLEQWLFSVPYLLIPLNWFGLLSYGFAVLGKRTGHGGGIDLSTSKEEPNSGRDLEIVEYLIYPWLFNRISTYWYDFILLGLTSFLQNFGAFLGLYLYVDPVFSLIFLILSTLIKPLSYMVGWKIYKWSIFRKYSVVPTAIAEFLTGFLQYLILGQVCVLTYFL